MCSANVSAFRGCLITTLYCGPCGGKACNLSIGLARRYSNAHSPCPLVTHPGRNDSAAGLSFGLSRAQRLFQPPPPGRQWLSSRAAGRQRSVSYLRALRCVIAASWGRKKLHRPCICAVFKCQKKSGVWEGRKGFPSKIRKWLYGLMFEYNFLALLILSRFLHIRGHSQAALALFQALPLTLKSAPTRLQAHEARTGSRFALALALVRLKRASQILPREMYATDTSASLVYSGRHSTLCQ
eukprot:519383-Pelagomonas_calceolata.AAC.11